MEDETKYAEALEQGCMRLLFVWLCAVDDRVVVKGLVLIFVWWMNDVGVLRWFACGRCIALCGTGMSKCGRVGGRGDTNGVSECMLLPVIDLLQELWLGVAIDDVVRLNERHRAVVARVVPSNSVYKDC